MHFDPARRKTLWEFSKNLDSFPIGDSDLLALVPEQSTADIMESRYLLTFHCTRPVVDATIFQREIESFRTQTPAPSKAWLLLFLAAIGLGFQLPVTAGIGGLVCKHGRAKGKALMDRVMRHVIVLA
jgi:hypothetical protein